MKQVADVILPIGLASEIAGSYFNNLSTNQYCAPASQLPGDVKPGWRVLRVMANLLNVKGFDYEDINEVTEEVEQIKIHPGHINPECTVKELALDDLALFTETAIYDVDMLARRSTPLQDTVHASTDNISMNSSLAEKLKLVNGQEVSLQQEFDGDSIQQDLFVEIDESMPAGSVFVHKCVGFRSDILNVTLTAGEKA
jgi:NADH-quinone oxidoreductase subunit G